MFKSYIFFCFRYANYMLISYYANKKSSPMLPSWQPSLIFFNIPIESGSIIKPCTLKHFKVTYRLHKAGYWTTMAWCLTISHKENTSQNLALILIDLHRFVQTPQLIMDSWQPCNQIHSMLRTTAHWMCRRLPWLVHSLIMVTVELSVGYKTYNWLVLSLVWVVPLNMLFLLHKTLESEYFAGSQDGKKF